MDYKISTRALAAIEDIVLYTDEQFGELQTDEYIGGMYASFETIARFPHIGRTRKGGKWWLFTYRQHYVFYRYTEDDVLISDIRNVCQALPENWEETQ